MDKPAKEWDTAKDAQKFEQLKRDGCHFARPSDLQWFQRRVVARGLSRSQAPIVSLIYGSWWHQKNKIVSYKDAERLYGISRKTAKVLYELICEEFELELIPVKTKNGRDKGFILKGVSRGEHTPVEHVAQDAVCASQEAQVCNAERTGMQPTEHLLETNLETKQETISTTTIDRLSMHAPLIRQFLIGKPDRARYYLQDELCKIQAKYGDDVVESQLQQGIAKDWKGISLANYEQYNKTSDDDRVPKHPCHRIFTAEHGFSDEVKTERSVLDLLIPT